MKTRQIICFIDPIKFGALLGDTAKAIGFYENGAFLGDSTRVVYVGKEEQCEVGLLDPDWAASAQIILIPDSLVLAYEPRVEFKVLHHTHTPLAQIQRFESLSNCSGSKEFIEDPTTIYGNIARQIKSGKIDFEVIWNELSDEMLKAEIDRFLNKVVRSNDLDSLILPERFREFSLEYEAFKNIIRGSYELGNPQHLTAFETFRKQLSRI
jgi:hypothetical protein